MNNYKVLNCVLNLFIVIFSISVIFCTLTFINLNKWFITSYISPEDLCVIQWNENPKLSLKHLNSIPIEEKKRIFKNRKQFKNLEEEEKILILQNYIDYLKMDREKRKKLKEIYAAIYNDM